ncbi:hypothetical protein [Mycolicibacterium sphagni]|uniref:Uncharacterized protein n=1 Tax=Mycolicibacterium sphagni TaxID=1786 RepID=A0ABX2JY29_9MYCO|nr:hypothetical protein [Mycolicibacterium sphagni]NTY62634.1 hypothetical protein [Mycolicibacterium sphagni]
MSQKNMSIEVDDALRTRVTTGQFRNRTCHIDAGVLTLITEIDGGRRVSHFAPGSWRFAQYDEIGEPE